MSIAAAEVPEAREPQRASARAILRAPFTRRARAELGYALLGLPLAVAGFVFTVVTVASGVGAVALAGLLLVAATTSAARAFGVLHRRLARNLLGLRIAEPAPFRPRPGFAGWLRSALTDPVGWRARGYLLLKLPVAVLDTVVVGVLWIAGLYYLTYPLWWAIFHRYTYYSDDLGRRESVIGVPFPLGHLSVTTVWGTPPVVAVGVLALLAAPWATGAVLGLDRRLIRWLLTPTSLSERVRELERTRAHAVDDSAEQLRRIERDLHDGAQAQLVGVVMKLGLAKEKLTADPAASSTPPDVERAYELVDSAHRSATEAIRELRELARGIHPPALDEGLAAALGSLVARSEVPVELTVSIAQRPAPAVETVAYFCVAELLANAAKHSHAGQVHIGVTGEPSRLRIQVSDDGVGGASLDGGTGLRGLADRVGTVDGRLAVASPVGGPTVVTVELPVQA